MIMSLVPFELFRSWDKTHRERTVMSTERWTRCPNDQCSHIVSVSGKKKIHCFEFIKWGFFSKKTVYKFVDLNDGIYFLVSK